MTRRELAKTIESTLLVPDAGQARVEALCREAAAAGFHAVCVAPCRVPRAVAMLAETAVCVVSVAGFPFGFETARSKAQQVEELIAAGAREVDLVMNRGHFLEGRFAQVSAEIRDARAAAGDGTLKVILETGVLTAAQAREAAALALGAGADFLKTSTGCGPGDGARIPDVRTLRQAVGTRCGIKAAGGIRTFDQAQSLLAAGADRIGTSAAAAIWAEAEGRLPP